MDISVSCIRCFSLPIVFLHAHRGLGMGWLACGAALWCCGGGGGEGLVASRYFPSQIECSLTRWGILVRVLILEFEERHSEDRPPVATLLKPEISLFAWLSQCVRARAVDHCLFGMERRLVCVLASISLPDPLVNPLLTNGAGAALNVCQQFRARFSRDFCRTFSCWCVLGTVHGCCVYAALFPSPAFRANLTLCLSLGASWEW